MTRELTFKPLNSENWKHMEILFGEKGACGGCWCMWWRLKNKEYELSKGDKNKNLLKEMIDLDMPLGILAFYKERVIGWCSVAPRKQLRRLKSSRILKPIDEKQPWSITCLFIDKKFRGKGLATQLILGASEYAKNQGATLIEAYPIIPEKKRMADVFGYVGYKPSFENAGFREVKRASEKRAIMRKNML